MRPNAHLTTWLMLLVATPAFASTVSPAAWPTDPAVNVAVCTAAGLQSNPKSIPDGTGGAIVTWQDKRNGTTTGIYAQHLLATGGVDGAWPANGVPVCTAAGDQSQPRIIGDGVGGAIIVWYGVRSPVAGDFDVYAQHVRPDGIVDPLWPADGRAVCTAQGNQTFPALTSDGAGGAIIAWQDGRAGGTDDIYIAHVTLAGLTGWTTNGVPVCTLVTPEGGVTLCGDGSGGAFVAWEDHRNGSNYDIYGQHVKSNGVVDQVWPANGVGICATSGDQATPRLVSDGAGGGIVAWQDARNGNYDVYAQRVITSGPDDAWPRNGVGLCVAKNPQINPVIVSDYAHGAIVAWQDFRGGVAYDIYAQHVGADGAADPAWPVDGRELCVAAGNQFEPGITGDGLGGAIVAWNDSRISPPDVYAQHVLPGGALDPAWPLDGLAVCTAAATQASVAVTTDGKGGAIVAWQDSRNGTASDVYAQRVLAYGKVGELVGVEPPATAAFSLQPVRPNPVVGSTLAVEFTLDRAGDARLDLLDASGRRVASRELTSLAGGPHRVQLGEGLALRPGVYLVRLRQGARSRATRVCVLR